MLDDRLLFTVTDLKQYAYCPRVSFYEHCLPQVRPRTYKMDAGRDRHEDEAYRSARRSLARLGIAEGSRRFDVPLTSASLPLTGIVDEIIDTPQGAPIPVDYKVAKRASRNHRVQLAAYALLLEEATATTVTHGFIYLIPPRKPVRVPISATLRQQVRQMLDDLAQMTATERMPPPHAHLSRCVSCEFRRFCNDVGL